MTEGPVETTPVGTESVPVETQPPDAQLNSGENGGGDNPKWQPFLDATPTQIHSQIKPILKEWDRGINQQFEEIHQRYAPFKSFIDDGIDGEVVSQAYNLLKALDSDPRAFYDQMGQHYGYVGTGGQESPTQTPVQTPEGQSAPEFDFGSPEANTAWSQMQQQFAEQQRMVETMAQIIVSQNQGVQDAEADKALDTALSAAREKHGDFDENYVLALVANGMDPDKAVEQFHSVISSAVANKQRPPAPQVIGGSANGSLPVETTDVTKLNPAQTRAKVADILRAAAGQNQ